jgi:hypothetical protein
MKGRTKPNNRKISIDWIAALSAIAAVLAAIYASNQVDRADMAIFSSERASVANTYIELRKAFAEAAGKIDIKYRMNNNTPQPAVDSKDWRALSEYWFLAFDEWLITKRYGNQTLVAMWDERYQELIYSQLENKQAYRAVFCSMAREKFSQSCLQSEFSRLYLDLYRKRKGKELCGEKPIKFLPCHAPKSPCVKE